MSEKIDIDPAILRAAAEALSADIAFDDIEECTLGALNLIVRERGFTPGYVPPEHRR